jgi:thymidylate synthase
MKEIVPYISFSERTPDKQYELVLRDLLEKGKKKTSFHAQNNENKDSGHKYCLELPARMLQYDLSNGIPILPIRDLRTMYKGAIGEVVAFINGAQTLTELISFGCPKVFWDRWVTKEKCDIWGLEEGNLGPGSYGSILTALPLPDGRTFNQVTGLMNQMMKNPFARTNLISTWYAPYAMGDKTQGVPRQVVVAPCHGNLVQFDVMDDRTMHMTLYQRSADMPVGVVLNLTEWVAFGMMVAYMANLTFTYYSHVLPNPQMYDIQTKAVEELISRKPKKLPTLRLDPKREITSITDFRKEDFILEDYDPHEKIIIPAAV